MPDEVVPPTIDANVEALVRKLGLVGPAGFVPVHPEADAVRADCFGNVDRKVAAAGGTKVELATAEAGGVVVLLVDAEGDAGERLAKHLELTIERGGLHAAK